MKRVTRHINPATILALVALVFAATGGAYAASSSGGNGGGAGTHYTASAAKKKKSSPKGARGPAGAKGATGAPGATGPAGPAGPGGAAGAKGENGADGSIGADGQSVTSSPETSGANCKNGGSKFVAASGTTYACNGESGAKGASGAIHGEEPLPSKATETGTWAFAGGTASEQYTAFPVASFPVQLAAGLTGKEEKSPTEIIQGHAHYINAANKEVREEGEEFSSHPDCEGTVVEPKAAPGNLCVYAAEEIGYTMWSENIEAPATGAKEEESAGRTGAVGHAYLNGEGARGNGTWAVTAE